MAGAYSKLSGKGKAKFARVLHEWKTGNLKRPGGQPIKDQKEAIAVAFSEARRYG